jgi:hypothetical protein
MEDLLYKKGGLQGTRYIGITEQLGVGALGFFDPSGAGEEVPDVGSLSMVFFFFLLEIDAMA